MRELGREKGVERVEKQSERSRRYKERLGYNKRKLVLSEPVGSIDEEGEEAEGGNSARKRGTRVEIATTHHSGQSSRNH